MSAPASSKALTTPTEPLVHASMSGVHPCKSNSSYVQFDSDQQLMQKAHADIWPSNAQQRY